MNFPIYLGETAIYAVISLALAVIVGIVIYFSVRARRRHRRRVMTRGRKLVQAARKIAVSKRPGADVRLGAVTRQIEALAEKHGLRVLDFGVSDRSLEKLRVIARTNGQPATPVARPTSIELAPNANEPGTPGLPINVVPMAEPVIAIDLNGNLVRENDPRAGASSAHWSDAASHEWDENTGLTTPPDALRVILLDGGPATAAIELADDSSEELVEISSDGEIRIYVERRYWLEALEAAAARLPELAVTEFAVPAMDHAACLASSPADLEQRLFGDLDFLNKQED